jgi:hypothetical protein
MYKEKSPFCPPLPKGDRGRIPSGCATMSGSYLTGTPRNADQGGKEGDLDGTDGIDRIVKKGQVISGQ